MPRTKPVNCLVISNPDMLSYPARVRWLYLALYLGSEDDGLLHVSTDWFRVHCYGGRRVSDAQIEGDLDMLEKSRWIARYTIQGRAYVALVRMYQDHHPSYPMVSDCPHPPADVTTAHPDFGRWLSLVRQRRREVDQKRRIREGQQIEFPIDP